MRDLYRIGAVPEFDPKRGQDPWWTLADYRAKAKEWFDTHGTVDHMVIEIATNGQRVHTIPFETAVEADKVWDQEFHNPKAFAHLSVWDRGANPQMVMDLFRAAPVPPATRVFQSPAGWIAAGTAAMFGMMAFGNRKRK